MKNDDGGKNLTNFSLRLHNNNNQPKVAAAAAAKQREAIMIIIAHTRQHQGSFMTRRRLEES